MLSPALVTLLLSLPTFAATPPKAMNGGCTAYRMNLQELGFWKLGAIALTTEKGKNDLILPLDRRVKLELRKDAKLTHQPSRKPSAPYAAVMPLRMANDGLYRVALGGKAWVEIFDREGKRVKEHSFEMQTRCDPIFKVVRFELQGGRDYLLQLTSSPSRTIDVSVSPEQPK